MIILHAILERSNALVNFTRARVYMGAKLVLILLGRVYVRDFRNGHSVLLFLVKNLVAAESFDRAACIREKFKIF